MRKEIWEQHFTLPLRRISLHQRHMEKTVLLVEDNFADVNLTMIAFRQINFPYQVVVANNGLEALDYLFGTGKYAGRDKNDVPILMLLDLKMPKMNGFEVLKKMRADPSLKHVFVAVLTSSREEKDRTEAMSLGADLYLQKAVDFDEFVEIVKQVESLMSPA
jgi:two-component system, response regulator